MVILKFVPKGSYWGHVNPIGIRSWYDEGKRCAEACFCYYRQNGLANQGWTAFQYLWTQNASK